MASASSARTEAAASSTTTGRRVEFGRSSSSTRTSGSAAAITATATSYTSSTRRHSLFGTEDRVVLDIGSKYTKVGFSGESKPRAIVSSVSLAQPSTSFLRFGPDDVAQDCLWDLDLQRCTNDIARREREALLLAQIAQLITSVYSQILMVDAKQRKVFIVENPLMPTLVKDTLCKVLFDHLHVPSVSFISAPLLSMVSVGRITGLVVEVGYLESTVTPVYYGRPLLNHLKTSPRAGKQLNQRLKALLLRHAKYIEAQRSLQATHTSLKQRSKPVQQHMLTEEVLEDIKSKALLVRSYRPPWTSESEDDETRIRRYAHEARVTPFTYTIYTNTTDPMQSASLLQRFEPAPTDSASTVSPTSPNFSRGVIAIPGWVRERAADMLFESQDQDEEDLVQMTLSVLSDVPIDIRRVMCENILVTGGTSMLSGFANRFRLQLAAAVKDAETSGGVLSVSKLIPQNMQESSQIEQTQLHAAVCVLNDPWPDAIASKASSGIGCAPALSAGLLAWTGASLTGALKTSAFSEITREAYDQALASARSSKATAEARTTTANEMSGTTTVQRPSIRGADNRGSFVGVVGGLETGAFGGLAAVSRHLVGVGPRVDPISPKRAVDSSDRPARAQ